mgnify:CR=1 FL=1
MKNKITKKGIAVLVLCIVSLISCTKKYVDYRAMDHDAALFDEWIEQDGKAYVHGYICFYSDGTGIAGSWESDIDWVNEEDFTWYTVNDKYLYIDGRRYKYSRANDILEIEYPKKTRRYRVK